MITEKIKVFHEAGKSDRVRPKVTKWKDTRMVRNHSFIATVREIIKFSMNKDVCRIGLIGDMGSGKSTLAASIGHVIHKYATVPYKIRIFFKEDLLNFEATLKTLEPINHVLIFDDVSFMGASANKKQIEMVKSSITTIRHLEGGKDVKIIIIMNYHYSLGLDKYLRDAHFKYITTVGSSENENMEKMFGTKYNQKIKLFKKYNHNAVTKDKWKMKIGVKELFTYKYRDPFIPLLFWNEDTLRFAVSPTRQWIDPVCSKCTEAEGKLVASEIPIDEFMEESEHKFGKATWLAAIKLNLFTEGMTVYSGRVVQAYRYLNRCRAKKEISLEQCATHYDLTITSTKLRKKMDGVMS